MRKIDACSDSTIVYGGSDGGSDIGNTANSPFDVQLFPVAQCKAEIAIAFNGDAYGTSHKLGGIVNIVGTNVRAMIANAPDTSRCTRGFAFVPNCKMLASSIGVIFRQTSGVNNFRYYLFKLVGSAPKVIAMTERFTPTLNLCVKPLINAIEISPDSMYYLGYYCDESGGNNRMLADVGDSDFSTSPILTCCDANEQGIGGTIGIGTPTQFRPWMNVNESAI